MRGTKAKAIRKMRSKCVHYVDTSLTRNSPYTVHFMRCVNCGAPTRHMRPMSQEAQAKLAGDLASGRARKAKA